MSKRVCSNCGNDKEVSGGKTREGGHFICFGCVNARGLIKCPLCKSQLR